MKKVKKNKSNFKKSLFDIAELLDVFRIIPRFVIAGYAYLIYVVVQWFMTLTEPNNAQSALVSVLVTAGAGIFSLYSKTGRNWNNE